MLAPLLQGCFFTGVESTPRITGRDVRREAVVPAPEDSYLAKVGDLPFSRWTPGKEFMVTDSRISRIFGASAVDASPVPGDMLRYRSAEESASVTGGTVTDISFLTSGGDVLSYRVNKPLSRLMADSVTEVPFTIQMSVIEDARRLMEGKEFYILTSSWRDDADTPVSGRKFIPVHSIRWHRATCFSP